MKLSDLMAVGRAADHPVAFLDDRWIPWPEFHGRVARLARALTARPERTWLLTSSEPIDFAIALFAVWHAGRRALIPPSLRDGAIADVQSQADGLLKDPATWPTADVGTFPFAPLDPIHTGLDLYTSGSSGEPKRISKRLNQLEAEVAILERLWCDPKDGPVLATVPHHHIYGLLFRLLWPLASGRPFDSQTCTAPEFLIARLEQLGPGRVVSSPSQLARMHELIPLDSLAGRATRIISSGGPLDAATAARFQATLGEAPLEILGSTETGGIAWRIQDHDDAWTPFPEVAVSIAEDVADAVANNAALTLVSPFLPDPAPLATGDAAELLEDGRFRLLGRLDRIVKIEEKRLSLAEMEARLSSHPWVREAALAVLSGRTPGRPKYDLPPPGGGSGAFPEPGAQSHGRRQSLGAVLVLSETGRRHLLDDGRAACARTLRGYLARWFDAVLLPRQWRYPDALPYNERGKLAAADLVRQFETTEFHHD